jgi:hypothetical protein
MLIVESGPPKPIPVPLGGGAIWRLRPATSFEVTLAAAAASRVGAGLAVGEDAVEAAAALLGDEFRGGDFTNKDWVAALVDRLVLAELALKCSAGWDGVCDTSKAPLVVDRGSVAMVLRDPRISRLVSAAVNSRVHIESADEKKSPASPSGGAKTDANTVQTANEPAPAAPAA